MKTFWKVFIVSSIFFGIAIILGSYSYVRRNENKIHSNIGAAEYKEKEIPKTDTQETSYTSLSEAFKNSDRINLVLLGMEDVRTDTILFVSLDPLEKKSNLISIPRDTYMHRKGYNKGEQRKINAIYGSHGVEGVKKAVSYLLEGVPIHHHVIMDYEGVEKIVDSLGGIEVVVPFHMKYKDPTATPPLNIDIKEGKQLLKGKESLDFLRYRKGNNKGGYIDGDLGRIKAQQQFLQSFIDKALSYRLPVVIRNGFNYVKTDIGLLESISYSKKILGIKGEDFTFLTLPGKAELKRYDGKLLSYFIFDSSEIKKLMEDIYKVEK